MARRTLMEYSAWFLFAMNISFVSAINIDNGGGGGFDMQNLISNMNPSSAVEKAPVTKADLPYIRCGVCESVAKHAVIVVENMRSMATQANKVRPGIDLDFLGTRH